MQSRSDNFEGWHYHLSLGVLKQRTIWGQDLQKTFSTTELTLPTPTSATPPSYDPTHFPPADSDSHYITNDHDLSFTSDTSISTDRSNSFSSPSTSGIDLHGLGLFGVVTVNDERFDGRLHLSSRSSTFPFEEPAISETTLDEVYATFCGPKKQNHKGRTRARTVTPPSRSPTRRSSTDSLTRSTISSDLKKKPKRAWSASGNRECRRRLT